MWRHRWSSLGVFVCPDRCPSKLWVSGCLKTVYFMWWQFPIQQNIRSWLLQYRNSWLAIVLNCLFNRKTQTYSLLQGGRLKQVSVSSQSIRTAPPVQASTLHASRISSNPASVAVQVHLTTTSRGKKVVDSLTRTRMKSYSPSQCDCQFLLHASFIFLVTDTWNMRHVQ